jgi:hypothetical protein
MFDHLLRYVPKVCSTDAQLLMRHHYETKFGIFDHDHGAGKDHPLALVMMHEAERTNGPLFERIERFEERQIFQKFGLPLDRFLSLPREVCDFLEKLAIKRQAEKNTTEEDALRRMRLLAGEQP